jgi:hypothetical protein
MNEFEILTIGYVVLKLDIVAYLCVHCDYDHGEKLNSVATMI